MLGGDRDRPAARAGVALDERDEVLLERRWVCVVAMPVSLRRRSRRPRPGCSFERAIERARPYLARARAGLADALRRRGAPGDERAADELRAGAAADAHALGMLRLQRELAAAAPMPRGSA